MPDTPGSDYEVPNLTSIYLICILHFITKLSFTSLQDLGSEWRCQLHFRSKDKTCPTKANGQMLPSTEVPSYSCDHILPVHNGGLCVVRPLCMFVRGRYILMNSLKIQPVMIALSGILLRVPVSVPALAAEIPFCLLPLARARMV